MTSNKVMQKTFENWLPLAIVIVIFSGLIYVAVQQNYRMSANDPQIQIASDISDAIAHGTPPDGIVSATPTQDLSATLATYVTIYSATGTPIGSSVQLDGKMPTLPSGVLDAMKNKSESRLTLEPKPGLRIAAVITKYSGAQNGYVLVGRSLKEIEVRINNLTIMTALATALALILTLLVIWYFAKMEARRHVHEHAEGAEHEHHHHLHEHHE